LLLNQIQEKKKKKKDKLNNYKVYVMDKKTFIRNKDIIVRERREKKKGEKKKGEARKKKVCCDYVREK